MSSELKPRIIVAERVSASAMQRLEAAGDVVILEKRDEAALIEAVAEADALVVRTYSEATAKVAKAAKTAGRLKVVGRAGVGVDNIDVRAFVKAGIHVVHTPAACTDAVADLTVGLIISLQRRVVESDGRIRSGEFDELRSDAPKSSDLKAQTLGVIGMGRIGQAVSRRLRDGFGVKVIYHDIREKGLLPFAATALPSAEDVYAQADVVTMHVPLTDLTRGMISAKALSHFRPGSYLINTSRGPVVDGVALADALKSGQLAGAAIDVFDPEPPPMDHPLREAPNCILTPHIASRTIEGTRAMNDVVDDVIGILQGKEPMYPVDPDTY
jgi:phosphoglycerate dehydrogenase-like enzyme